MNRILPKFKYRCRPASSINIISFIIFDQGIRRHGAKIEFIMAFSMLFSLFSGFLDRNSPNDPRKFSTLAVSKVLGASLSLPNLTIIGAQSRPYGAMKPKKANKSNFNTGISAGNEQKNSCFFVLLSTYVYRSSPNFAADRGRQYKFCHRQLFLDPIPSFCARGQKQISRFFSAKIFLCDKFVIYEPNLTKIKIQM